MTEAGPSLELICHSDDEDRSIDPGLSDTDYSSEESEVILSDTETESDDEEDVVDPDLDLNPWMRVYPPEDEENSTHQFHETTGPQHPPAANAKSF